MRHAPLYIQIAEQLRSDIIDGKYPLGSLLPTEIQLEQMFQVSKITIRNAVKILTEEGYVTKKSGVGTRVVKNNILSQLEHVASFSSILASEANTSIQRSSLDVVEIDESHEYFPIFGNRYRKFKKYYYNEGVLVAAFVYSFQYFDFDEDDQMKLDQMTLHEFLASKNYDAYKVRDEFVIIHRSENSEAQEVFEADVDLLLKRGRTVLNHHGMIIGFHTGYIDTQTYPYVVEFEA
ncbi:hypothetical protein AOC36_00810 [Erysipelothrix larvae]|uniref:HTH gntR-type domain-containing protein n=1 Tax=Erysipelothrix larvae TaxID=1514105 RepID=A0A109UGG4_9FIRM|nr:GntR family transcriptional regulator [Erysipelothrix larvae]AMC92583.1 hypothetical protein AOC36_00810 [Erysipelothrix larvae]